MSKQQITRGAALRALALPLLSWLLPRSARAQITVGQSRPRLGGSVSSTSQLRAPLQDKLVDTDGRTIGMATKTFQDYLLKLDASIPSVKPLVVTDAQFGAAGNGSRSDTLAFQKAIDQAIADGGGTVLAPPGTYSIDTITIPAGDVPITLLGYGRATILKRRSTLAAGKGLIDIKGSSVTIQDLLIDGNVLTPAPLFYNGDFSGIGLNDPMAASLTGNTSIWLHGGTSNFTVRGITVQHTGGYAVLIDAISGGISDVQILSSTFTNNRPSLFGAPGGQAIFGSWNGGIYVNGDGRAANPGLVVKRFLVSQCRFLRDTGNCIWSHLYGLDELHEDFQWIANYFLDCGLDAMLVGGVTGGAVVANVCRRIGYTTLTDTDRSVPRWLPNLNATGLDSSGLVKGVVYSNNSFLSVNGGAIDMDGHGDSVIIGNVCRVPYPDEAEYDEDQIAISGPNNDGSYSYGINISNSSNTPYGAANLSITGNTLINLRAGLVRLFAARRCSLEANVLIAADNAVYPPVALGPIGPTPNQRCLDNRVAHNKCNYSPAASAPMVFEDGTFSPFVSTEKNSVFGNCPITGNGNAVEFQKDPNSGSVVYLETPWFT